MLRLDALITAQEFRPPYGSNTQLDQKIFSVIKGALDYIQAGAVTRPDGKYQAISNQRFTQIFFWLRENIAPKLNAVIKEELNVSCTTVIKGGGKDIDAAMTISLRDVPYSDLDAVLSRAEGTSNRGYKEISDVFDQIRTDIDPSTCMFGPKASAAVDCKLFLSTSLFVMQELYDDIHFTAGEITSIILHEIGHMITLAMFAGAWRYRAIDIQDSINYVKAKTTIDQVPEIVDAALKEMEGLPDNVATQVARTVLNTVKAATATDKLKSLARMVSAAIIAPLFFAIHMIAMIKIAAMLSVGNWPGAINSAMRLSRGPKNITSTNSETQVTQRNYSLTERSADAFVAAQGRGNDLASALVKLAKLPYSGKSKSGGVAGMAIANFMNKIGMNLMSVIMPVQIIPYTTPYDDWTTRIKMILENSVVILKDQDLDKETRNHYIEIINQIKDTQRELAAQCWKKRNDFIFSTLLKTYSPATFITRLTTGSLTADYDFLQKLTSSMIRNTAYHNAARIASTIDNL